MYIDLIIFILIVIFCLVRFKKFTSYVFAFGIVDIAFRVLAFIKENIPVAVIKDILAYLPESIAYLAEKYTSGVITLVLLWIIVVLYIIFDYLIIKIFSKKRK